MADDKLEAEAKELERKHLIEIPDISDCETAAHNAAVIGMDNMAEEVRNDPTVIGVVIMIERDAGYRIRSTYSPDPFRRLGMLEMAQAETVREIWDDQEGGGD